jgi:hypothetical protein
VDVNAIAVDHSGCRNSVNCACTLKRDAPEIFANVAHALRDGPISKQSRLGQEAAFELDRPGLARGKSALVALAAVGHKPKASETEDHHRPC